MWKQALTVAFVAALLVSVFSLVHSVGEVSAQSSQLSMPEEYLNYTIVAENGTLWAKIDGLYPIRFNSEKGTETQPMYYPTPPDTTNIHVYLDGAELSWSNYSETDPFATHHTDIGDWQMIYCAVKPAADDFELQIHYEHPVQIVNGTYTFLYDLNITPYLSAASPKSTAHFRISFEANASQVNVYRTGFTSTWTPMSFNRIGDVVMFDIVSEFNQPLLGDIAVTLPEAEVPEFSAWILLCVVAAMLVFVLIFRRRRIA